jgi:hypothetical protein
MCAASHSSSCEEKRKLVMPGTRVRLRRPGHRPIVPGIDVFTAIKKEVVAAG